MNRPAHLAGLPLHVHPLDDPQAHRVALAMGKMVAQGVVYPDDVVPTLIEASAKRGHPNAEIMHARLSWTLADAAAHWLQLQKWADYNIRQAVVPMLEGRRTAKDILEAAHAENARLGEPLVRHQVRQAVEREISYFLSQRAKRHAR